MMALRWMASFQESLAPRAGDELDCARACCEARGEPAPASSRHDSDSEDSATGVVALRNEATTTTNDDLDGARDQQHEQERRAAGKEPVAALPRHPHAEAALAAARTPAHPWSLVKTRHWPLTEDGWRLHLLHVRIDPEALRAAEEAHREAAAKEAATKKNNKKNKKGAAEPTAADPQTPPPPPLPPTRRHPILMVPGLASAAEASFDLAPTQGAPSLAEDLARRGWDVWIADLRGNGRADRPMAPALLRPLSSRARWTVDTHLELDAPCVLSRVLIETGADSLHWMGHSMGGMLGCGLLSHPSLRRRFAGRVRSLTLLGSGCFGAGSWHHRGQAFVRALTHFSGFPAGLAGRGIAAVNLALAGKAGLRSAEGLFFWPSNVEPGVGRALLRDCFSWMPPTLVGHFLTSLADEAGLRRAGSRREEAAAAVEAAAAASSQAVGGGDDGGQRASALARDAADRSDEERRFLLYADPTALEAAAVPVFALNGDRDLFCPAAGALRTVRLFRGSKACRRFFCVGRSRGNARDHYGHFDIICGRHAAEEAWPHVARWLDEHDGQRPVEVFLEAGIEKPRRSDLVGG